MTPHEPPQKKLQPFLKGPPGQRKIRHFARAPSLCTLFCGAPGRPRSRQIVSPRGPKEWPVKHATLSVPPKNARRGSVFLRPFGPVKYVSREPLGCRKIRGPGDARGTVNYESLLVSPPKVREGLKAPKRPYFTGPGRRPGRRKLRCFPEAVAKIT